MIRGLVSVVSLARPPGAPVRARPESPLRLVRRSGQRFGSVKRPHSRHPFLLLSRRQLYPRHFFDDLIWNQPDKRTAEFGLYFWVGKRANNDGDSGPPLFNCSRPLLRPHLPAVIHRRRGAARVNGRSERRQRHRGGRDASSVCVPSSLCVPHAPLPIFGRRLPIDKRVGGDGAVGYRGSQTIGCRRQNGVLSSILPSSERPFPVPLHPSSLFHIYPSHLALLLPPPSCLRLPSPPYCCCAAAVTTGGRAGISDDYALRKSAKASDTASVGRTEAMSR